MAVLATLANRLRAELGDIGKPFSQSFIADGTTSRFQLSYKPVQGSTLIVKKNTVDISDAVSVSEASGLIVLDDLPEEDDVIYIEGIYYRYFTDPEINDYVTQAFNQHSYYSTDAVGRRTTLSTLDSISEYPVVILASTMALYTLATDAAFDIDIFSPDGVTIPRSERFRQLNEMIQTRQAQYQELCEKLGIGMYKIEVFNLRRISWLTNRYVPMYRPLEVGDFSLPERVYFPVPTYGGIITPDTTGTFDLNLYQGDSFEATVDFPFDITGYNLKAQIRPARGNPIIIAQFAVTDIDLEAGTCKISLTASQTEKVPQRSFWDLQLTTDSDPNYRKTFITGVVYCEREVTTP